MTRFTKMSGLKGTKPFLSDVYPDKAQYNNGQDVYIKVEVVNPASEELSVKAVLEIYRLEAKLHEDEIQFRLLPRETKTVTFCYKPPYTDWCGYGADISLFVDGITECSLSTAFDVAASWKKATRYGFLCDFYEKDEFDTADVEQMARLHLNMVQFYDWMYRHERLLPDTDVFTDPLNRRLSMNTVRRKVEACREYGMKALAYGAVYGASEEFYRSHQDWALYDNNGQVIKLGNWLAIMNTAPASPWVGHIVSEFRNAVKTIGFDGMHLDTYGFPKDAYSVTDGTRRLEKLNEHFPELISSVRNSIEEVKDDAGVIFNAVGNWPVNRVAPAEQDAVYIEVWDPNDRYRHLHQIISNARENGKKPVILAAYLKPFANASGDALLHAQNCFLLASAVIFASGAYHILLGENKGLLTEGYFVNYSVIDDAFFRTVRNYYDFIVRYANLLYDPLLEEITKTHSGGINEEFCFANADFSVDAEPGKVWTIIKENTDFVVINLINLSGILSDKWNEAKEKRPVPVQDITVEALIYGAVEGVYSVSPDSDSGICRSLEYEYVQKPGGRYIRFRLPELDIWELVFIRKNEKECV